MRAIDWLQLGLFVAALAPITKPMGLYFGQVLDAKGRTQFDPILKPLERIAHRLMGTQAERKQDWKQYTIAMLLFSATSCVFTYAILRLQNHLLQTSRVVKARNLPVEKVQALVHANTDPAGFGIPGEPGVNVLALNLALDELH